MTIIFLPVWLMGMPISVIEGLGPLRSLSRLRALTKSDRSELLIMVLIAVIAGVGLLITTDFLVGALLSFCPA